MSMSDPSIPPPQYSTHSITPIAITSLQMFTVGNYLAFEDFTERAKYLFGPSGEALAKELQIAHVIDPTENDIRNGHPEYNRRAFSTLEQAAFDDLPTVDSSYYRSVIIVLAGGG